MPTIMPLIATDVHCLMTHELATPRTPREAHFQLLAVRAMQTTWTLYDTAIGKKAVIAITGTVLFVYVIGHMLGNLQIYLGPEAINAYSAWLHGMPALLWSARVVLLVSFVLHIVASMQLAVAARKARPTPYRLWRRTRTDIAALTMKYSGPLLGLFIIYHVAHLTWPGIPMGEYEFVHHDVYSNVVNGFSRPWVSGVYITAQVFLGLHLYHGGWSLVQSLGFSHPRFDETRRRVLQAIAIVVVVGNISVPTAVLAGLVR